MRLTLLGERDTVPESVSLGAMLMERGLSKEHPLDVLEAFRLSGNTQMNTASA